MPREHSAGDDFWFAFPFAPLNLKGMDLSLRNRNMKTLRVRFGILLVLLSTIAQPRSIYAQETEHGSATQQPVRSAAEIWAALMKGNQRFVAGTTQARESVALRKSLANSQHPKVVVLTCSDSRVSPELIFDKNLGDLFVVRSAGNVADAIGVGSI